MPKKLTQEEFITRSNEIHKGKYDYSLVDYKNNSTKVKIICPEHGVFEQTPSNHLSGKGCKKCAIKETANKRKLTLEEFSAKANKIHNNKYDYSLVNYVNYITKVKIICPIHGIFEQTPEAHLAGEGCPICGIDSLKTKILGVGNTDTKVRVNGKLKDSYITWRQMLTRCYDINYQKKYPTYVGCYVCKEWLNYSEFEKWYNVLHIKGTALDKDIIKENNRLYSPETCCFVPNEINCLFKSNVINSVSYFEKDSNKYVSSLSILGKSIKIVRNRNQYLCNALNVYFKCRYTKSVSLYYLHHNRIDERTYSYIKRRIDKYIMNIDFSILRDFDLDNIYINIIERRINIIKKNRYYEQVLRTKRKGEWKREKYLKNFAKKLKGKSNTL